MPIPHLAQCLVQRDGMATYAQGYDETRRGLFSLSDPDINFPNRMFKQTHTHAHKQAQVDFRGGSEYQYRILPLFFLWSL